MNSFCFNRRIRFTNSPVTHRSKVSFSIEKSLELIKSAATVFDIIPSSSSFFIGSVRLRSMDKALCKLRLDMFNSDAIWSRDNLAMPLWHSFFLPLPISPFLYPFNSTYVTRAFRSFSGSFFLRPKLLEMRARSFYTPFSIISFSLSRSFLI